MSMWYNYIENNAGVFSIYNTKAPSLENVYLKEFIILSGEDIRIQIKIDTHELPQKLPEKWEKSRANTVQLVFEFLDSELQVLNINNRNFKNGFLKISELKEVIFYGELGSIVFQLTARWIYLKSITGYQLG